MTVLQTEKTVATSPLRGHILELVREWGGSAADAVLEKETRIFQPPLIEGVIGYRLESGCAIAYGDPVSAPKDWEILAQEFCNFCQKQGWRVIFMGASKAFADIALQNVCSASIEFGEELIFDPNHDPRDWTGVNGSLVRRKVRHAIREGVEIQEYTGSDPGLEKALEDMSVRWLASRNGPQIHISNIRLFENRKGKRWLYAKQNNAVVGAVVLNQLKSHDGWLLNHLMITPEAPHGTPELLFVSALEILKKEGCRYVTVGAVPAERLGQIVGLASLSSWISRTMFHIAKRFFHLNGRSKFWEKFHPQGTQTYLLFKDNKIGFQEILGILRATNSKIFS